MTQEPSNELALPFQLPQNKFVQIFQAVHNVNPQQAELRYQTELFNFTKLLYDKSTEKNDLLKCTEITIKAVFLDVISAGLSFSPASKHIYLLSRSTKTPHGYEQRLYFQLAPDGKTFMCQKAGSLERTTPPQMVYEGDEFNYWTEGTITHVVHKPKLPRTPGPIMAGFCYQVFPNGSMNAIVIDALEIGRRAQYSAQNNGKWVEIEGRRVKQPGQPNDLYTSFYGGIDPGFLGAKLIDAATKGLRRAPIESAQLTDDEEIAEDINYAVVGDTPGPEYAIPPQSQPQSQTKPLF